MDEEREKEVVRSISINMDVAMMITDHFMKANWLHCKDYIKMVEKAEKKYKEENLTKKQNEQNKI